MFTKKQITENSWIVNNGTTPWGYLRVVEDRHVLMVGAEKFDFDSYKAVEAQFGKIKTITSKNKAKLDINGFPVRHDTATPVDHPTLPAYIAGGKAVFVAGFVAIKYAETKFWQVGDCVKIKTVEDNTHHGPFKTRLEAMHHVKEENRKANV